MSFLALAIACLAPQQPDAAPVPSLEIRRLFGSCDAGAALTTERQRLIAWLDTDGHRAQVHRDPRVIEQFHDEESQVRWVPRIRRDDTAGFDVPCRELYSGVATASNGSDSSLVEFVPVEVGGRDAFDLDDIDLATVSWNVVDDVPYVRLDLRDPSEKLTADYHGAFVYIVGGEVFGFPLGRADGVPGQAIATTWTRDRVAKLVSAWRGAETPATPALSAPRHLPRLLDARVRTAALKANRRALARGVETPRLLTCSELSSWTYTDGLAGLPPALGQLDGTAVAMLGYLLPIDDVTNIREFLFVDALWDCAYGVPPNIHGIVRVTTPIAVEYTPAMLRITGAFSVRPTREDGMVVDVYQLAAKTIEPIKRN